MQFRPISFNTEKAIQAAAVLLRGEKTHTMSRMRLLKLLYIANRKMLQKHGRQIFQALAVSMENGPVHSEVYELIKGGGSDEQLWSQFFRREDVWKVALVSDPGAGRLSQAEIEALSEATDEMAPYDDWEVSRLSHRFAEYENPGEGKSKPIPIEDIINAVGMGEYAAEILLEMQDEADLNRLRAS